MNSEYIGMTCFVSKVHVEYEASLYLHQDCIQVRVGKHEPNNLDRDGRYPLLLNRVCLVAVCYP